jgi:subtilisin family serine protease
MDRTQQARRLPATMLLAALLVASSAGSIAARSTAAAAASRPAATTSVTDLPSPAAMPPGPARTTAASSDAPAHRILSAPATPASPQALIVKFRSGTPAAARASSRGRAGVDRVRALGSIGAEVVRPRGGRSVESAVAEFASDPAVEYAEPDAVVVPASDPAAEPFLGPYQWALDNDGSSCAGELPCRADVDIDAVEAWPIATGAGVTVAVLDDGVDLSNPELTTQAWVNPGESGLDGTGADRATNGIDDDGNGFVDDVNGINLCDDASPLALHVPGIDWHGSAVASVLGAAADGSGMVGAAPDARIMAVRWLEPRCSTVSYAVEAIDYAIANGAQVINASWGAYDASAALLDAVERAADAGVLIVAAAGNEGSNVVLYPAAYHASNVVSVGAITADGRLADYSSRGSSVDLAAPGSGILAIDVLDGGYALVDGTSFATPLVAGIAALVGEVRPELLADPAALRARLIGSGWVDGKVAPPRTASGRVADARNALDLAPPTTVAWLTGAAAAGSRLGQSTVSIRLTWPAATDDLAIDAYRVRYRRTGGSSWSTTGWTIARSATARLALGATYDIELTTRDAGTNKASVVLPFRAVRHQERYATYHRRWRRTAWSSASGGHTEYATRAGSSAQFTFTGRSVALVMPTARANGGVRVYVDGVYLKTLHLHASKTHPRRVDFQRSWSTSGTHTVRLVVVGTAGHPRVDLDAIVIGR